MKRSFLYIVCMMIIPLYVCIGQNSEILSLGEIQTRNVDLDSIPLADALLWKVSLDSTDNMSYVFGTVHMIKTEDFFLPPGTESALESSKKVVFEIDLNDMMDIGSQLGMLTKAFMSDGTSLKDLISQEDYQAVETRFNELGLPFFLFERMKPLFLSTFASGEMSPGDLNSGRMTSYEMEFYEKAKISDKAMGGLETVEYQLAIFDSIPYSEQAKMLVESIKSQDEESAAFKQMMEMYKNQQIESMHKLVDDESGELGGYEDLLLKNRNENWIPLMVEFMAEGPTFFAVGAGHLAGPNGILRLLKKSGYTVEPVLIESNREIKRL